MKRLLTVLCLLCGVAAGAQVRPGIVAGITSSDASVKQVKSSSVSLYHAGVVVNVPLGLGFALQPGVMYQMKGASLDSVIENGVVESSKSLQTKVGYLEVPLQLQWGPDLLAFRPYALAEAFVGYGLTADNQVKDGTLKEKVSSFKKSAMDRTEYGFAVGGGIEIWRVQLSLKYFRNLGALKDAESAGTVAETVRGAFKDGNWGGLTFSLGVLF